MKEDKRHYFVDEAGDLTLFNKRGKVIIGSEGCSNVFILGVAHIVDPHDTRKKLEAIREEICSDPYLSSIPSVKGKSSKSFHAKDDCSEVRMAVYKLIKAFDVKAYCIIRRKEAILQYVKDQNRWEAGWRYDENKIYDSCVKRLFKDRLHSAEENHITFSQRGKSKRSKSLRAELEKAVANFEKSSGKKIKSSNHVVSNYPTNDPCLQIIDYLLWAVQRLYERHEDRYFNYLSEKYIRIIDLDDKRERDYGVYYDQRNPLTAQKIKDSLAG